MVIFIILILIMVHNMDYLYGTFSDEQIKNAACLMHKNIHRLLLYKDKLVTDRIFNSDDDFKKYFEDILFKFGGLNTLLGCPNDMLLLISTLQAAYDLIDSPKYSYRIFRKAILDSHGYIKAMLEEVNSHAKPINS
jgi:hypothetical protein|nr:MAG TPA: hypothetical protein [Caudoviricetes sp.]DAV96504.1 MAG TPA: hypothetical protein [Caudoviricetes sp.]